MQECMHTSLFPVAKQAKALRQRLRVQQGEDSDDAAAEDDDGDQQLWGKKRRVYYGADEEGATDEDEVCNKLEYNYKTTTSDLFW